LWPGDSTPYPPSQRRLVRQRLTNVTYLIARGCGLVIVCRTLRLSQRQLVEDSGWVVSYVAGFLVLTVVTTKNTDLSFEQRYVTAQKIHTVQ
jgi:hypothetical protein